MTFIANDEQKREGWREKAPDNPILITPNGSQFPIMAAAEWGAVPIKRQRMISLHLTRLGTSAAMSRNSEQEGTRASERDFMMAEPTS